MFSYLTMLLQAVFIKKISETLVLNSQRGWSEFKALIDDVSKQTENHTLEMQ